ncbi:type II secretion system F family protein [Dethiobacter alkaliphilus]|uniref:Type II secretion system protein n=1 Tax=Dethiobacter alkaliphilus AHT 1 TaxID=555088 RepID=C0GE99_DETAL|nr:type II secretion system F family protein [Dethiobacter alkaliphilus]EEG78393.1 type II secretion system protein [Dethiobacter alkaliphilus AHT 1]
MVWLVNLLVFITAVLMVMLAATSLGRKHEVMERLGQIRNMDTRPSEDDIFHRPFRERVITPFFHNAGNALGNLAPSEIRQNMEKNLIYAGHPWNLTVNTLLGLQVLFGIGLPVLGLFFLGIVAPEHQFPGLFALLLLVLGFMMPNTIVKRKATERQKEIQRSLPDMLDLLLVSVDAGLAFDMALKKVADKMPGELSREIGKALDEIRMGKTRIEALRSMANRTGVPDISTFISAVIQAEQLGSNIAKTLDVQANTMRQRRRMRAEEEAMRAPIKMLFPLVFFIFPALFVVLLGPAGIRIVQTFINM